MTSAILKAAPVRLMTALAAMLCASHALAADNGADAVSKPALDILQADKDLAAKVAAFRTEAAGHVMTVRGPVAPAALGVTLPHEHLFIDFRLPLDEPERWRLAHRPFPDTQDKRQLWKTPVTLDRLAFITANLWAIEAPLQIASMPEVAEEVAAFRAAGGGAIVDVTTKGLGRDPARLEQLSRKSGLHIVMGAGWYRDAWRPADFDALTLEDLTRDIIEDIVTGESGVRAGIIGEIPAMDLTTAPVMSGDVKQLRAAARASRATGAAISLHQWVGDGENLMKTLDILEADGADLGRVIIGHVGGNSLDQMKILEQALARGATLEFDLFGIPFFLDAPHLDNRGSARGLLALIENGYAEQLLMSHDVCTKLQHKRYGGKGFDYILNEVVLYLRASGVGPETIDQILIANPARLLTFSPL